MWCSLWCWSIVSHCGAWIASGTQHLVPGILTPASFGSFSFSRLTLAELTEAVSQDQVIGFSSFGFGIIRSAVNLIRESGEWMRDSGLWLLFFYFTTACKTSEIFHCISLFILSNATNWISEQYINLVKISITSWWEIQAQYSKTGSLQWYRLFVLLDHLMTVCFHM